MENILKPLNKDLAEEFKKWVFKNHGIAHIDNEATPIALRLAFEFFNSQPPTPDINEDLVGRINKRIGEEIDNTKVLEGEYWNGYHSMGKYCLMCVSQEVALTGDSE